MRQHALRFTLTSTAAIVLVLALAVMVNVLGARHWLRGDWTGSHVYTLSEKTKGILEGLSGDIRVVVFMTPASPLYEEVHELLGRYAALSPHIKVEYIDPDREPLKTRQLAQEFGISVANTVVLAYGDRSKYVTSDQMAEYDYSGMQMGGGSPNLKAFKGEEQLTAAILSLVSPRVPKVYLVTGHGEAQGAAAAGAAERSASSFGEALKRENMEVAATNLLAGHVPDDADALLILGPTQPYTDQEIAALDAYLKKGGRLLICLDPLLDKSGVMRSTRLEELLHGYGVEVHSDVVVDPSRRLPFFDLSAVYLTDFKSHPVTTGLEGVAALFPFARSLSPLPGAGRTAQAIIETSSEGWGETDLGKLARGEPVAKDDKDTAGPVAVGVEVEAAAATTDEAAGQARASAPPAADFRIVALGNSAFLLDDQITNAGNQTLAVNAVDWLVAREESLGISPREVERVSLFLSREQLQLIFLVAVVLLPGAAIAAGLFVWRRRRH